MTLVKFDKAVKYAGIRYAAHEAFKVEDCDVDQLKMAGATVLSVEPVTPPQPEPSGTGEEGPGGAQTEQDGAAVKDVAQLKSKLLEFTLAQLINFAEENGINLRGKTRKAEIYNIIVSSLN